jgi:hypothetical protein
MDIGFDNMKVNAYEAVVVDHASGRPQMVRTGVRRDVMIAVQAKTELEISSGGQVSGVSFKESRFGGFIIENHEFSYSPGWTNFVDMRRSSNESSHGANTAGAQAEIVVYGNRLAVYGVLASDAGVLEIYLNDVKVGSIDQYRAGAPSYDQLLWDSGDISYSSHVLRLVSSGTKSSKALNSWVRIDHIEVATPPGLDRFGRRSHDHRFCNHQHHLPMNFQNFKP